jgi:predicted Fe-S protein YdhL (DUF1289 family)
MPQDCVGGARILRELFCWQGNPSYAQAAIVALNRRRMLNQRVML